MRTLLLVLFAASALAGFQAERRTYVFDPEGRRSLWSSASTGDARRISTGRDMNGRETRVEEVQEKVLRDSGGVKVVERLIRRFDPNGRPLPPEKELVETTTRAGGAVSTATTTFKTDLNGRLQPAERVIEEVRESGARTTTETRVERPNISGAFAPVERRVAEETTGAQGSERQETSYLPDTNGRFQEALRRVARTVKQGDAVREQIDEYQAATSGQLQLSRQSIAVIEKDPRGGERRTVDIYGPGSPGRPAVPGQLSLRERQIVEITPTAQGAVETFSIQRPALQGRGELSEPVRISETVCTGKCLAPPPSPPSPAPPAQVEQKARQ